MARVVGWLLVATVFALISWLLSSSSTAPTSGDAMTVEPGRARDTDRAPPTEPLVLAEPDEPETTPAEDRGSLGVAPSDRPYPTRVELAREYDALLTNALAHELERLEETFATWTQERFDDRFAKGEYKVVKRFAPGEHQSFQFTPKELGVEGVIHSVRCPDDTGEFQLVALTREDNPELYALRLRIEVARERIEARDE